MTESSPITYLKVGDDVVYTASGESGKIISMVKSSEGVWWVSLEVRNYVFSKSLAWVESLNKPEPKFKFGQRVDYEGGSVNFETLRVIHSHFVSNAYYYTLEAKILNEARYTVIAVNERYLVAVE